MPTCLPPPISMALGVTFYVGESMAYMFWVKHIPLHRAIILLSASLLFSAWFLSNYPAGVVYPGYRSPPCRKDLGPQVTIHVTHLQAQGNHWLIQGQPHGLWCKKWKTTWMNTQKGRERRSLRARPWSHRLLNSHSM